MSAVNIVRRAGEILIATDGMGLMASDRGRRTLPKISKISLMPHIPLAVAVRGNVALAHLLTMKFICDLGGSTFQGFVDCLPALARGFTAELARVQGVDPPCEVYVAGFSPERSRLETYFMACSDLYVAHGRLPFTPYLEEEPMTAAPQPSEEAIEAARFVVPPVAEFQPQDHGVKLMDAQRRTYPDEVGGFLQMTRLTPQGISSRVIHRWPETSS